MEQEPVDVAVIGAGIVGLGIAWTLLRSGRRVTLIDPAPAQGATFAAAGMLAPVSEYHYQEEDLLTLTLESAALWEEFAAPFGPAGGHRTTPTLVVGFDAADRAALADLQAAQQAHGLEVQAVSLREARRMEPLLSPQLSGAFLTPGDHQVDPRMLHAAMLEAFRRHGGTVLTERADGLQWASDDDDGGSSADRVAGVLLASGGVVLAGEVVVANGLASPGLRGLPEGLDLPIRPVHGDILRLRVPERLRPFLSATVRGSVRGIPVYLVPREDGTVVIGATQREDGQAGVSAGGVHQLLRDAQQLVPAVAELELEEITARARPGTPDNAPLLGRVGAAGGGEVAGLVIATGFFRHGVLLTPVAARAVLDLLKGHGDGRWAAFRPDRFSPGLLNEHTVEAHA
ncbi:glycine oxidase ThiO [Arthrobacter woluwensis]|uniref:glycine oxidase ThiO n=1 Tax=Arthrobacter woluwensis TaxID=156980 RepID=UPI001AAF2662|nr:glycine oxidase ThiO [Arthrobacter woluwensis]QTF72118.1 glycine oxidase ThiO [Arthrobacter woluwensis]